MISLKGVMRRTIRWYQTEISAGLPRRCRYSPTCSQYAFEALEVHGVMKGTLLSAWRLVRCNPWSKGGVDRVPARGAWPSRPLDYDDLMDLYREEDHVPNT